MQSKLANRVTELKELMEEVDEWPQLVSENRLQCDSKVYEHYYELISCPVRGDEMLDSLREASQSLFNRFVELRQHVEMDLRTASFGDQGQVDPDEPLGTKSVHVSRVKRPAASYFIRAWTYQCCA